jgi:nicotinamide-nucleotide amidase
MSDINLDFVRIDRQLVDKAVEALDAAQRRGLKVVTAESCTGGLPATVLSEAPGAAEYFDGGFVTLYLRTKVRRARSGSGDH